MADVAVEREVRARRAAVEWPTVALTAAIYGGWLAVTWWHAALPWPMTGFLGAVLLAWHGSLQHEILHGHPTRWTALNRLLGLVPLTLWLPYDRYRDSHLKHHRDENLTDPLADPESYYWAASDWQRLGSIGRLLVRAQTTMLGRMLLGPPWNIARFLGAELRLVIDGDAKARRAWALHLILCVPVVLWVVVACRMSLAFYVAAIVLPGYSILLIRSFAEHRAKPEVRQRIAIVEDARLLGPVFLYNSIHAVHHARPGLPWYEIPAVYRAERARWIAENGGLVYRNYLDVARRYLLRPHDAPVHPLAGGDS